MVFVMKRMGAKLEIAAKRQHESFVRLMMLETWLISKNSSMGFRACRAQI